MADVAVFGEPDRSCEHPSSYQGQTLCRAKSQHAQSYLKAGGQSARGRYPPCSSRFCFRRQLLRRNRVYLPRSARSLHTRRIQRFAMTWHECPVASQVVLHFVQQIHLKPNRVQRILARYADLPVNPVHRTRLIYQVESLARLHHPEQQFMLLARGLIEFPTAYFRETRTPPEKPIRIERAP